VSKEKVQKKVQRLAKRRAARKLPVAEKSEEPPVEESTGEEESTPTPTGDQDG